MLVLALMAVGGLVWAGIVLASLISGSQNADDSASAPTGSAQPAPTASPSAPAAQATESAVPAEPSPSDPSCDPDLVQVSASTDAQSYAPDQDPVLTLTVTNTGDVDCPVNVGTSQMEFLVTSGDDRIFSSADCQDGAEDLSRDIAPGSSEEAKFTWERNRSVPGCEEVEENATPGSYDVRVSLGELTSEEATFELQ